MKKILKWLLVITIVTLSTFVVRSQNNYQIKLAHEYYSNGELEKAKKIFDDLAKSPRNVPLIHSN